jgi:hypothetical protein
VPCRHHIPISAYVKPAGIRRVLSDDDRDPCQRLRKRVSRRRHARRRRAGRAMGEQHAKGWRVSRHRLVVDATVGIIANPMSGRDIRRLVVSTSVFLNAEKASMVVRLTAAAGALGVGRVLLSTDTLVVSAAVLRESRRRVEAGDPRSKLRTSRHAKATSGAVVTAWRENWASGSRTAGSRRRAARRTRPPCRSQCRVAPAGPPGSARRPAAARSASALRWWPA